MGEKMGLVSWLYTEKFPEGSNDAGSLKKRG